MLGKIGWRVGINFEEINIDAVLQNTKTLTEL
jgi:hypothetical protein